MQTYHEPETAQPTETELAAIIAGIRAEHDARAPADAWRITQRAIRRWTRRRHMKPLSVVAPQHTRPSARRVRTRTV
jgi:hypothetical protein